LGLKITALAALAATAAATAVVVHVWLFLNKGSLPAAALLFIPTHTNTQREKDTHTTDNAALSSF